MKQQHLSVATEEFFPTSSLIKQCTNSTVVSFLNWQAVHTYKILFPVVDAALSTANCQLSSVNAIAFTQAPGLIGSLLVGAQFAKSLSLALNVPLIAVHHMQAHVLANLISEPKPSFPFLCLTVSGGHTQIVVAHAPLELEVIGETIDDAAGEAFDKTAKMIGLPYPGGTAG
jgi:N6-L-threonylcarbamoyladenine synthase